ncbi:hypothetical protein [Spirosoma areae]
MDTLFDNPDNATRPLRRPGFYLFPNGPAMSPSRPSFWKRIFANIFT